MVRSELIPIVVAGPTACGKSAYAIELAERIGGEIVCADSRQVYAHMNIGTAGPSDVDLKRVKHHGFGVIDPEKTFSAGDFVRWTDEIVGELLAKNIRPILVGGTGMYLRAWRFNLNDVPKADPLVKARLLDDAGRLGLLRLYERLAQEDPETAYKISSHDAVRIIRALEIIEVTGKKVSELRAGFLNREPRQAADWRLLWPERTWLKDRIHQRVQNMFVSGLVDEACALRNRLGTEHLLLKTMGYFEALMLADGQMSLESAIELTTRRHNAYAKRQMTWFKKEDWWTRVEGEACISK